MQQLRKMCVLSLKRPVQEEDSDHLKKKRKEISSAKVCHRRTVPKIDLEKMAVTFGKCFISPSSSLKYFLQMSRSSVIWILNGP